jgi:hypothetical protein
MDSREEIIQFLRTRRARIPPERAGFGTVGHRRVSGLRREEVAVIAGVSVEYYKRIERGALAGVSAVVLSAIASALQLDESEADHLFNLARAASATRKDSPRDSAPPVRPGIQRVLDGFAGSPASVHNERTDLLATNRLGRVLYSEVFDSEIARGNIVRFTFLDPRSQQFYPEWEQTADQLIAVLRGNLGRSPGDRALANLIGELSTRSRAFSTRWAAYNVKYHRSGRKQVSHPIVGALDLDYEAINMASDPGLTIMAYFAEPDSPSAERLALLASWAATADRASIQRAP